VTDQVSHPYETTHDSSLLLVLRWYSHETIHNSEVIIIFNRYITHRPLDLWSRKHPSQLGNEAWSQWMGDVAIGL